MGKHTPGPWKVVMCNSHRQFEKASIRPDYDVKKAGVHPIASVYSPYLPTGRANAKLIASAPLLLEALKDAHAHIADDRMRARIGNIIFDVTGEQ